MRARGYALLDSGRGLKLERLGEYTLVRPSSLAFWEPARQELWSAADATYEAKKGWRQQAKLPEEWPVTIGAVDLLIRLQKNGQIGLFPEHNLYLDRCQAYLQRLRNRQKTAPKVLNLFAYTGLATLQLATAGAHVTHVDISKSVLNWARANTERNKIPASQLRFIQDDVLTFVKREIKRGNRYDLIVADPPSFSRPDGGKDWVLEDIISDLLRGLCALRTDSGALVATCHSYEIGGEGAANILRAELPADSTITVELLSIAEEKTTRRLQAGILVNYFPK